MQQHTETSCLYTAAACSCALHVTAIAYSLCLQNSAVCADYKSSLRGVDDESYKKAVKECHERSAFKLQKLCFANGGIYVKLGQHVAQLVCI